MNPTPTALPTPDPIKQKRKRKELVEYTTHQLRDLDKKLFRTPHSRWISVFNWSELYGMCKARYCAGDPDFLPLTKKQLVEHLKVSRSPTFTPTLY